MFFFCTVLFTYRYLYPYEDILKKLGTMNTSNSYFGRRTSLSSDSRRSLMRIRRQSEEKSKSRQLTTSNNKTKVDL